MPVFWNEVSQNATAGYQQHRFQDQDPINLRAVGIMDDLHDALEAGGYRGHELERFLVRILFCLFAEDTGIFDREAFRLYIEDRTKPDGFDLGLHLARLFALLNTPPERRQANLDETLAAFPFVNGELFAESLGFADFNRDMRNSLLACTRFDWSQISPAIFGSLFQGIMEPRERRQVGGHYTSERDILKVVGALFLDDLKEEFQRIKGSKTQLKQFHQRLSQLRFLDPACGCGNFLVVTYRELRLLEIELLKALDDGLRRRLDIRTLSLVDVDAFFGIEINQWPARIAEVAMWLMDHQMNVRLSEAFGQYFVRLPLTKSPRIVCDNALRRDWKEILPPEKCSYILGNPPFVGGKHQTKEQRADMAVVAEGVEQRGLLDYVTGWYFKAAGYLQKTKIVAGFVSTSSVTQGEQVGALWNVLFRRFGLKIHFAHRTFPWESEARGKAHVHVVIIGFAAFDTANKRIFEDHDRKTIVALAKNINPYLIDAPDLAVVNRQKPLCNVPEIGIGNKPIDDGNYLFTPQEKADFLKVEPKAKEFFRPWLGAEEYINGRQRWCLWLGDCPPEKLRQMPAALNRVKAVREFRLASRSAPTRKLAETPARFHVENMPSRRFLLIPRISSERRRFIPMGFVSPKTLVGDHVLIFSDATLYHFGVLSSTMHMAWARQVCGRLESRYRYSAKLVYNNYPWPESPNAKQVAAVETAAQSVLDVREEHLKKGATPADLYDPLAMPRELTKAHAVLDRAVDRCYRSQPFRSERQRVELLFALYEKMTAPLMPAPGRKKCEGPDR
jgi:hypothetical protein